VHLKTALDGWIQEYCNRSNEQSEQLAEASYRHSMPCRIWERRYGSRGLAVADDGMYRDKELCCCLGRPFFSDELDASGTQRRGNVNPVRLPSALFLLSWPPLPPNFLHLPKCNLGRRLQKPLMFLASRCWPAHTGASLTGAVHSASPTLDRWRTFRRKLRVRSLLSCLLLLDSCCAMRSTRHASDQLLFRRRTGRSPQSPFRGPHLPRHTRLLAGISDDTFNVQLRSTVCESAGTRYRVSM